MLFEYLPDVYFFAKNANGLFVMANELFIKKCGKQTEKDIIGKDDYAFFPVERARQYIEDDTRVMTTGKSLINKVELAPELNNSMNWFITTKVPLFSHENVIIGLAGIARDVNKANLALKPYAEMSTVVEHINKHYSNPISIKDLAQLVNLSVSQFERKFRKVFQIAPMSHIINVRIKAACNLLINTDRTISTIAQEVGFYDHSHMTRLFTELMSMPPKEYRKRHS